MNQEIVVTLDKIKKSLIDCLEALRLVEPIIFSSEVTKINKTSFANATLVIRDALLHRAVLSIVRIYDINDGKNNKDRIVFDRMFRLLEKDNSFNVTNIKNKYKDICLKPEFHKLKEIRHGRIAHQLEDSGAQLSYEMIKNIALPTAEVVQMLYKEIFHGEIHLEGFNKFWVKTSRNFWKCIFNDGLKYVQEEQKLTMSN